MFALPLPLLIPLMLLVLMLRLQHQLRFNALLARRVLVLMLAATLCAVLSGGRIIFPWAGWHMLVPLAAASLPAIAWYCLADLQVPDADLSAGAGIDGQPDRPRAADPRRRKIGVHALAPLIAALAMGLQSSGGLPWLDLYLGVLTSGYGLALLHLAYRTTTPVSHGPVSADAQLVTIWCAVAGIMLLFTALADAAIALDFAYFQGRQVTPIQATADVLLLVALSYTLSLPGRITAGSPALSSASVPETQTVPAGLPGAKVTGTDPAPPAATADQQQLFTGMAELIHQQRLFADAGLTLERLARRMRIPARALSEAVNRVGGCSFSQLINGYRIAQATRLLADSQDRVTDIMLESGFQTKSNFNREFLRVTGISPSEYRRQLSPQCRAEVAVPAAENLQLPH